MSKPSVPSRYEALDACEYQHLCRPGMTLSEATSALGWISHAARQDEAMLWAMLVLAGVSPRAGAAVIGMPTNRLVAICYKWAKAGIYDYESSCDLGWVDEPDPERMRRRAQSAPRNQRSVAPVGARETAGRPTMEPTA